MGIHGLTGLISSHAPLAISYTPIENLFNRKIAIDASMSIYQFLIGIRGTGADLTNESGEVTSHLQGILTRTVRLMEFGVKPVYVFDGEAPELKKRELEKRRERAEENAKKLEDAEEGTEDHIKYGKRTIRVSREQNSEVQRLLKLLGVPIVMAPSEAEAQCAALCKAGLVWAAGSEDMDTLTFGTPILARNLTFTQQNLKEKGGVMVIDLQKALEGLGLSQPEFINMCILCGCDYSGTIKGIGPVRALSLVQKYKTIEAIIPHLDKDKNALPEPFPYTEIIEFFSNPPSVDLEAVKAELKWGEVDEDGLVDFLCKEKGFQEERIRKICQKIKQAKSAGKGTQNRLDQFFSAAPKTANAPLRKTAATDPKKSAPPAKKYKK
nr:Flap structure-specific endonuclease 1 [Andalucia godoyi]|eukprot:ANDGO_03117.mRNA.1 Flap endonuclease 1